MAFFDEDAAATRIPLFFTARMNLNASGKALNRPCSINWTTCFCLASAYSSLRRSRSGTPKYSSAARAPANRGLPAISCWYTWVVNRSAVQLVRSRISSQSPSNSSSSASRHASSCGESTSTPSTSKIAPWYPISPHRSRRTLVSVRSGLTCDSHAKLPAVESPGNHHRSSDSSRCPQLGRNIECDLIPGIDASVSDAEPYDDHVILGKRDQLPKVTVRGIGVAARL